MDSLIIEVDIGTQRAVEQTQALVQSLQQTAEVVAVADQKIEQLEATIIEVAEAEERAGKSAADMAKAYGVVKTEAAGAATSITEVGVAADTAKNSMTDAGNESVAATDKIKTGSAGAATATDGLTKSVGSMAGAYLALHTVVGILKELEDRTKAVIEAQQILSKERFDLDSSLQELGHNLLGPDVSDANQKKLRDLVLQVSKKAGDPDLARVSSILTGYGTNGYNVLTDPEAQKMAAATDAWAVRTGTSGESALNVGKLMHLSGAKTADDADKIHAILDAAFQETPIANSGEFLSAAVKAVAAGIGQNVPIEQSLALFAASAVGTVDPSVASSRLGSFNTALSPSEVSEQGRFGYYGKKYGVINDTDIQKGIGHYNELHPNEERERSEKYASERKSIEQTEDRLAKERGSRQLALRREEDRIRQEEIALEAPGRHHTSAAARELKRQEIAAAKEKLAADRSEDESAYRLDLEKVRIAKAKLDTTQKNEQHTLEMAGAGEAMKMVPLAQRQALVFQMLKGKSPEEQGRILSEIMPAGTVEDIKQLFGPAQLEQMAAVLKNIKNASASQVRSANEAYGKTMLGQEGAARAASTAAEVETSTDPDVFADQIVTKEAESLVKRDPKKYKSGFWPTWMGGSAYGNDSGAKAGAMTEVLKKRMVDYWLGLTDEQRKNNPKLRSFIAKSLQYTDKASVVPVTEQDLAEIREEALNTKGLAGTKDSLYDVATDSTGILSGDTAMDEARAIAVKFGKMQNEVKANSGKPAGQSSAPGSTLPLPPGARSLGPIQSQPGSHAPQSGPVSIEYHSHYNTHISSWFAGDSGGGVDLPGRLDGYLG